MKLLNVRLDADDTRLVSQLRQAGVEISRVVREAIRAEHGRRVGRRGRPRPAEVMAAIYAAHPDPPGLPRRRYDMRDRRAARRAIVRKLRRVRP